MFDTAHLSEMTLDDLRNLAQTGEGMYLEFKRTIPSAEKIAREIAAFANSKGGRILVGVDDDKSLVGIEAYQEDEYLLSKAARENCIPEVNITMELVHLGERDILIVSIPGDGNRPVYVQAEGEETVYIRDRDKSVVASNERVMLLTKESSSNGVRFEYGPRERKLFRYLNEYEKITAVKYSDLIDASDEQAAEILINLVSAGILKLITQDQKEYFCFTRQSR